MCSHVNTRTCACALVHARVSLRPCACAHARESCAACWLKSVAHGSHIALSITDLQTERNADFLRVYDGPSADPANLLAEYSGDLVTAMLGAPGWASNALVVAVPTGRSAPPPAAAAVESRPR